MAPLLEDMGTLSNHLQAGPAKSPALQQNRDAQMLAIVQDAVERLKALSRCHLDNPVPLIAEGEAVRSARDDRPLTRAPPPGTETPAEPSPAHVPAAKGPLPRESVHPSNRVGQTPPRVAIQGEAGSSFGDIVLPAPTRNFDASEPSSALPVKPAAGDSHAPRQPPQVAAEDSAPHAHNGTPAASTVNASSYAQSVQSKLGTASPSTAPEGVKALRLEFGSEAKRSQAAPDADGASASVGKVYGRARRRQPSLSVSSLAGFLDRPQEAAWNPFANTADSTSNGSTTMPSEVAGPRNEVALGGPGKGGGSNLVSAPSVPSVLRKPPTWGPDITVEEELPPYLRDDTVIEPDVDR